MSRLPILTMQKSTSHAGETKLNHSITPMLAPMPYLPVELWIFIFSISKPNDYYYHQLRWLCKIYRDAIPPPPLWTSFPHPNYSTLRALMKRLNKLAKAAAVNDPTSDDPTSTCQSNTTTATLHSNNIPTLLFIDNGVHDESGNYINIKFHITIIGQSRDNCSIKGGLLIKSNVKINDTNHKEKVQGQKEQNVVTVKDLTVCESKKNGIYGYQGASFHLHNVHVYNSGCIGVYCYDNGTSNQMIDCEISRNKRSGLYVKGCMTIAGAKSKIHHNCNTTYKCYGLEVAKSSTSMIHIILPLTKESLSVNNLGRQQFEYNYKAAPSFVVDERRNFEQDDCGRIVSTDSLADALKDGQLKAIENVKIRQAIRDQEEIDRARVVDENRMDRIGKDVFFFFFFFSFFFFFFFSTSQ